MIDKEEKTQELSKTTYEDIVRSHAGSKSLKRDIILFVGLGGLGIRTVNKIKKIHSDKYEVNDLIDFLAVDTDERDLRSISIGSQDGYLTSDETFSVFDPESIGLLLNPPEEVKGWIGEITPVPLGNQGARATRQIGRLMLCGTSKYADLKTKIKNKTFAHANNGRLLKNKCELHLIMIE